MLKCHTRIKSPKMSRTECMLSKLWTERSNSIHLESTRPHTLTSTLAAQNTVLVKINGNFCTQKNRCIKKVIKHNKLPKTTSTKATKTVFNKSMLETPSL